MNQTISPGARTGSVCIPASKSQAHRLLICAALGAQPVALRCDGISADIAATVRCLRALGADITDDGAGTLRVVPIAGEMPEHADLLCGESGSTLRFLLPVAGALGADVTFHMQGRLPQRPWHPERTISLTDAGKSFWMTVCCGRYPISSLFRPFPNITSPLNGC